MTLKCRQKRHRQYPFRRKFEETPSEALERLDKKLTVARADLGRWRFKLSNYAIHVTDSIRQEIGLLKQERNKLLTEMKQRHQKLLATFPNANAIEEVKE